MDSNSEGLLTHHYNTIEPAMWARVDYWFLGVHCCRSSLNEWSAWWMVFTSSWVNLHDRQAARTSLSFTDISELFVVNIRTVCLVCRLIKSSLGSPLKLPAKPSIFWRYFSASDRIHSRFSPIIWHCNESPTDRIRFNVGMIFKFSYVPDQRLIVSWGAVPLASVIAVCCTR